MRLAQAPARGHKFVGRGGVEFEHLVMTRDYQPGVDFPGQLRGLAPPQISCHAPLGPAPIDRQQGHVDWPAAQPFDQALIPHRIAAVINKPAAELDDVTKKLVTAIFVLLELFRGRTALYGSRHLLQIVAVKRRQAAGLRRASHSR